MDIQDNPKNSIKIALLGDTGVGCTTLLQRYLDGLFSPETKMTIAVDFRSHHIIVNNQTFEILFVDIDGCERWKFFQNDFLKGLKGGLILFDLTRPLTLENMEYWVNLARKEDPNLYLILVGSKIDLVEDIMVDDDFAQQYQEYFNFSDYINISAKTGLNVQGLFESLFNLLLGNKYFNPNIDRFKLKNLQIQLKKRYEMDKTIEKLEMKVESLKVKLELGKHLIELIEKGDSGFEILFEMEQNIKSKKESLILRYHSISPSQLKKIGKKSIKDDDPWILKRLREEVEEFENDLEYQIYKKERLEKEVIDNSKSN